MREDLLLAILKSTAETDDYVGRTLLVTGASGQIGLNIIALALARGARVVGLYNKTPIDFPHPRLTMLRADLTAKDGFKPPPADILINTVGIWMLPDALDCFVNAGIERVVAFGSTSLFGKRTSTHVGEQAIVDALAKAEQRLLELVSVRRVRLTVLRPTLIYGMGLDGNITRIARIIRKFGFLPICYPALGLRQPVQARDLAEAALAAWDKPSTFGKAYNLGGGETIPYREMVERLFRYLGRSPRLIPLPFLPQLLDALSVCFPSVHVNGEIARRMNLNLTFDNGPAEKDFGYRPRGFLVGDIIL